MQLFEHYQQLLEKYEQKIKQKCYPSVDEIADCLNISTRYTKTLLKQMNEVKWISWLPQRGRGKKSTLILNLSKNDILVEQALQKLKKGDFTEAVKIIKQLPSGEYPNFLEEFQRHLGIQEEKVLDDSKDIFRYAFYQSIISLDPALILSRHEAHIAEHIYDTLVIYNEEHKSIVPHLAHQ
jgi:MarR-like DNA-binding transcriptional regulator SgrR of sgrS sRNA|nr:SgrR family transcriptional regulator [Heyndrickxia oleronia]